MRLCFSTSLALLFLAVTAPLHAQKVLFQDDFEQGLGNWTTEPLWHLAESTSPCLVSAGVSPFPSGTRAAWFGSATTCDFSEPWWNWGQFPALSLVPAITLPMDAPSLELSFSTWSEGEADGVWDLWLVRVRRDATNEILFVRNLLNSPWRERTIDLSHLAGETIRFEFAAWPGDPGFNEFTGWVVDDVVLREGPAQWRAMCAGDGTLGACPCDNQGGAGRGCANSFQPLGAELAAFGVGSVTADTLVLAATGVANASVTLFQGGNDLPDFFTVSGDGLLCTSGALIRIASGVAAGNAVQFPGAGQQSISVRGLVQPGQLRVYQARYRNAAAFCTPATYNFTNGIELRWWP